MKLFLAITAYDGKINDKCSQSILENCLYLTKQGHTITPFYDNDIFIDRSRNFCADVFLASDCSDLIFIDSDLGFPADAIAALIQYDRDIVAGAYRYKKNTIEFPVILDFSRGNNCKDEETGLVLVESAPTGLMRIQRSVFDRMAAYYVVKSDERGIRQFFETGVRFPDSNNWYGEDSFFCRRWRDMGGDIWVEPRIDFTHIGRKEFAGNYHEYLMGRRAENADVVDRGIPGWTTDKELSVLKLLAARAHDIVEIGCWKGRSTKALLEECSGKLYAVDHWQGSKEEITEFMPDDAYSVFMANVGHYLNLVPLKGDSRATAATFDQTVDMIFIDGGHSYDECKADIEAWLPKCNKTICGHDYSSDFPGVIQAVTEKFDKVNVAETIWWVDL